MILELDTKTCSSDWMNADLCICCLLMPKEGILSVHEVKHNVAMLLNKSDDSDC